MRRVFACYDEDATAPNAYGVRTGPTDRGGDKNIAFSLYDTPCLMYSPSTTTSLSHAGLRNQMPGAGDVDRPSGCA